MSDAFSTTLLSDKAPADVVKRNRERANKRRLVEELDAFDFLTRGHDDHECLFEAEGADRCAREYDPLPVPEAALTNELDYVGTGIGLLYGLDGQQHAWQLAGWNVRVAA